MSPAWVKATGTARVQNDLPGRVEREHPLIAAVDIHQITGRAQAQAARINDPAVLAERPGQLPVCGKAEKRAVPVAVLALVTTIRVMTWLAPLRPAK